MKVSNEIKENFKYKIASGDSFSFEVAEEYFSPYFEWNAEKEEEKARRKFVYNILKSYTDEDGVRDLIAFNVAEENESEQLEFCFVDLCEDKTILKKQRKHIDKQIDGLIKTKHKIMVREYIVERQMTMDDFISESITETQIH